MRRKKGQPRNGTWEATLKVESKYESTRDYRSVKVETGGLGHRDSADLHVPKDVFDALHVGDVVTVTLHYAEGQVLGVVDEAAG